jgi:Zn-dependent protease with chaperone function
MFFVTEWDALSLLGHAAICLFALLWLDWLERCRDDVTHAIGSPARKDPPLVTLHDIRRAYRALHAVCRRAGCRVPKMGIARNWIHNAYAAPDKIMLTVGIIRLLDDAELEALIAHELAHQLNHDSRRMRKWRLREACAFGLAFVSVLGSVALIIAAALSGGHTAEMGQVLAQVLSGFVVLALLARLGARAHNRGIEFEADALAASLTTANAVQNMLRKLGGYGPPVFRFSVAGLRADFGVLWSPNIALRALALLVIIPMAAVYCTLGALERVCFALWWIGRRVHGTHPSNNRRIRALA